jgi:cholesterol transport system auxiliary component
MKTIVSRSLAGCSAAALLFGTVGCAGLLPKPPLAPAYYMLDDAPKAEASALRDPATPRVARPTLAVNRPHAASGYDSAGIVYTREAHRLDTYANSVWVDTPAHMLMPMMVAAIESAGVFPAVVQSPSAARADMELDTEILRLQHDFSSQPSRVRFTLRASLVDSVTRRVLAGEQFESVADSPSEDARGGVLAAHAAVRNVLTRLAALCSEAEARWRMANKDTQAEREVARP